MSENNHMTALQMGFSEENREIYLFGEVTESMAVRFYSALRALENDSGAIRIIVNSPGGSESDGYAIYDLMMESKSDLIIEAYGQVSSIAAAIFQAGDLRLVSSNCEMLIHNGTVGTDEETQQDDIIAMADRIKRDNEKYYAILTSKSKLTYDQVKLFCKDERTFTAKETVRFGLADKIIGYNKKIPKKGKK